MIIHGLEKSYRKLCWRVAIKRGHSECSII